MAGMTACWMLSVRLVPDWRATDGPALLKSVYGFVWLDFGLDIVLRFLMLAYNAVEWGNGTRGWWRCRSIPLTRTLDYCGLFWMLVTLAYCVRGAPPRSGAAGSGARVYS